MPWCNLSPSKLLIGQRLRSLLPLTDNVLIPQWPYLPEFRKANKQFKGKQKEAFDKRHRTRERSPLRDDCEVWVTSGREPVRGRVVTSADAPRSYLVNTPSGMIRKNQQHFQPLPEEDSPAVPNSSEELSEKSNRLLPPENADNNNPPSSSSGTDEPQSGCRVQT